MTMPKPCHRTLILAFLLLAPTDAAVAQGSANQWSITEFQYQGGYALQEGPFNAPGFQNVFTWQHASGWSYGENFFFVDLTCCEGAAADRDAYSEWYSFFDYGAISGREVAFGPVSGIGPVLGVNWAAQAKMLRWAPGVRFRLDLPGFDFANLDVNWLLDQSAGIDGGGAPKASNSFVVDFNGRRPLGGSWSVEGHGEWHSGTRSELGSRNAAWVLLQPQLRLDLGEALRGNPGRVFVGTELHIWWNKLGSSGNHEVIPQLLAVFRF